MHSGHLPSRRSGRAAPRSVLRRVLIAVAALVVLVVAAAAVLVVATPSVYDAGARVRALAARDGATILRGRVPPLFAESIVASEDSRFYSEPGIDPVGIARAAWFTVTRKGVDPGGSTLSQQLAKQLYTGGRTSFTDDAEQLVLAVKLNLRYSKARILQMYASTVYFGNGFYGLPDASCGYFAVPPRSLTLAQASLLAGLVQAPSAYDPLKHLPAARARQRYVIGQLVATGKISRARGQAAARAPLHLVGPGTRRAPGCG